MVLSIVLIGGIAGGVIVAAGDNSGTVDQQSQLSCGYQALLDRACAIYEQKTGVAIDSEQLNDALGQAQVELRDQGLESRLQNLVDEGKITQQQADQYLEWWQSPPDIEAPLPGLGRSGPGGGMMQPRGLGPRGGPCLGRDASGETGGR